MELKSAKHKGIEAMLEGRSPKGMDPKAVKKIRLQLTALQAAANIHAVQSLPGWRLEEKTGPMRGTWSMWVSGNDRLTFKLETPEGPVIDLWFGDYH